MDRLENMYNALDALRQMGIPVSQEQKQMLAKLEEEHLYNELVPTIREAIAATIGNSARKTKGADIAATTSPLWMP